MAEIVLSWNLLNDGDGTTSSTSYVDVDSSLVPWDNSKFNNISAVYFEATMRIVSTTCTPNGIQSAKAVLYDNTAGADITGSELTTFGAAGTFSLERSGDIKANLPSSGNLKVRYKQTCNSVAQVFSAHLIIELNNATKFRVLVDVGANTNHNTTTYKTNPNPKLYYHTSANWDGTIAQSYGCTIYKTTGLGTVLSDLYNVTSGASVAGSEVSTSSTTPVYLQSGSITLTNNREYTTRIRTNSVIGSPVVQMLNGHIIFDISDSPTKFESIFCFFHDHQTTSNTVDTLWAYWSQYDTWSGCTRALYYEGYFGGSGGNNAYMNLYDDGVKITNSEIASTSSGRVRSASTLTEPADGSLIQTYIRVDGGTGNFHSSRLIIVVTGITYGALKDVIGRGVIPWKR